MDHLQLHSEEGKVYRVVQHTDPLAVRRFLVKTTVMVGQHWHWTGVIKVIGIVMYDFTVTLPVPEG